MSDIQVSAKEIAEKLRIPGTRFPIRGTVLPKSGGAFCGEGTIQRDEDEFVLRLTFTVGGEAPVAACGSYSRDDYWRFEGEIGLNLPIIIKHLGPGGTRHWHNGITTQHYHTRTITLPAVGFDSLSARTIDRAREILETNANAKGGESSDEFDLLISKAPKPLAHPEPPGPSPYADGVWIHALVPDFPLIHTNGKTEIIEKNDFLGESSTSTADTFSGSFDGVTFGLIRRGDDLNVYLFLPAATDESLPVEKHEQFLTAFLTGLAFATGQHCWPYQVTVRQNGIRLLEKLHAVHKLDRTSFAPFSERIGFNATVGSIEWEFVDFLGKAARFFNAGGASAAAASKALWLVRASGAKGTPGEITLSALCVVLESLAGLIFAELNLESMDEATSFESAKSEVKGWLDKHQRISDPGFSRLRNLVSSAALLRPADKYRATCDHFGLQWNGLMKDAWDMWKSVRHKTVHSVLVAETNNGVHDHFTAVGRIAGAINILVPRLIGYSGIARTSVYEDKHHKI